VRTRIRVTRFGGALTLLLAATGCPEQGTSTGTSGGSGTSGSEVSAPPARWLNGIRQGDLLTYRLRRPEQMDLNVRMRVQRLVRRGESGVAAEIVPDGEQPTDAQLSARWLAGDETGLYQMNAGGQLADPGFVPLDASGRVIAEARAARIWRIPPEWHAAMEHTQGALDDGWSVDDLEMTIDGPVRGDRCATIQKREDDGATRVLICANLGAVQVVRLRHDEIEEERWTLVEVGRSVQSGMP